MDNFESLLAAYGVAWSSVKERFGDDKGLYVKCLGMFVRDQNLDELDKALDAGDFETAFRAAHTVKGMSANMGFDAVFASACRIVEPLRARQTDVDYPSLFAALCGEMQKIAELAAKADGV